VNIKRVFAVLLLTVASALLLGVGYFALFAGLVITSGDADLFYEAVALSLLCLAVMVFALWGVVKLWKSGEGKDK